jgi:RNA polymerase sigma-70 factor (ECF subfamily)
VTESEIIQKCHQGDREAQKTLYERTSDSVYRMLLRMTGNKDDAFELAQETYLRVFKHIRQFDGASSVTTWICRIAINEARQFLRRRKRYDKKLTQIEAPTETDHPHQASDARLDVEQALASLPEQERVMLVLRYFDGMSYAEMAEVLEKPPGTIASGLNRAREHLRGYLEEKP